MLKYWPAPRAGCAIVRRNVWLRTHSQPLGIGQKQKWFLLRLISNESRVRMDRLVNRSSIGWRWVSYWYPLGQVVTFKREGVSTRSQRARPAPFHRATDDGVRPEPCSIRCARSSRQLTPPRISRRRWGSLCSASRGHGQPGLLGLPARSRDQPLRADGHRGPEQVLIGKVSMAPNEGLVGLVRYPRRAAEPRKRRAITRATATSPRPAKSATPRSSGRRSSTTAAWSGVLVIQQKERRQFDEGEEAFLVTMSAQLAGVIAHAEATGSIRGLGRQGKGIQEAKFVGVPGHRGQRSVRRWSCATGRSGRGPRQDHHRYRR